MFKKGMPSANPSGRPAFAKMIASFCKGGDTKDLIEFAFKIRNAEVSDPANPDAGSRLFIPIALRWEANKWLSERLWGKAQQSIDVTSHEGLPQGAIDFGRYTDAQLLEIERLHALGSVDAEFSPVAASLPEGKKNT